MVNERKSRKITFSFIVGWVLGIIFSILAYVNIFEGHFITFFLLLLIIAIIFPPLRKYYSEHFGFILSKPLSIILAIILICLVVSSNFYYSVNDYSKNFEKETSSISSSAPTQSCVSSWRCGEWSNCSISEIQRRICVDINGCNSTLNKPSEVRECVYVRENKIGDSIKVGDLVYTVSNFETKIQIGENLGNEYSSYWSGIDSEFGTFYIFTIKVKNEGSKAVYYSANNLKIIDSQARIYDSSSGADYYLKSSFTYDQIQPGTFRVGQIAFDVPKNLQGKLQISDESYFGTDKETVSWS